MNICPICQDKTKRSFLCDQCDSVEFADQFIAELAATKSMDQVKRIFGVEQDFIDRYINEYMPNAFREIEPLINELLYLRQVISAIEGMVEEVELWARH